jgi:MoaA/NifB/PqqE/SkfB family radical SAM enzyme
MHVPDNHRVTPTRIRTLGLFLTRRCNFACSYCCTETGEDPADKLSQAELQDAVRQAKAMGARAVVIAGEGEPLLDPILFPFLDFLRDARLKVKIYTNGSAVTAETARRLFARRVAVVFKLHALNERDFNTLAGIRASAPWEEISLPRSRGETARVPKGLVRLLEAGYRRCRFFSPFETGLQIESVITRTNLREIPAIARLCRGLRLDFIPELIIGRSKDPVDDPEAITPSEEAALYRELAGILGILFRLKQRVRCRFETDPFLDVSGKIRHCFGLPSGAGSIRDTPLAVLHARELQERLRQGWKFSPFVSLQTGGFRRCATRKVAAAGATSE